jgi:hypothetical protein
MWRVAAGQVSALVGTAIEDAKFCSLKEGISDCAGAFLATALNAVLVRRICPDSNLLTRTQATQRGAKAAGMASASALSIQ